MILPALRATALLLVLTTVAYPAIVTVVAQVLLPESAAGSLVRGADGRVRGSVRIGQGFTRPEYLHGRPSAAGWDASASAGSNLGPSSARLAARRAEDRTRLLAENPEAPGPVPEVLLATSASGLDPHLPPDAARWQLPRIARARGVRLERLEALLADHVEGRDLGVFGEPRVNVLTFNLALDRAFPATP